MTTLMIYFGLLIVNIIMSIDLLVMKNAMLSSTKWKACLGKNTENKQTCDGDKIWV